MILMENKLLEHSMQKNCKKQIKKNLEFRIEFRIKRKGDKLYFKWKEYNDPFNNWIDKKYINE